MVILMWKVLNKKEVLFILCFSFLYVCAYNYFYVDVDYGKHPEAFGAGVAWFLGMFFKTLFFYYLIKAFFKSLYNKMTKQ
jgi:hypothetical protein|nr:MAG TPA: hypothetical protein [Caudoviricetes sp.]